VRRRTLALCFLAVGGLLRAPASAEGPAADLPEPKAEAVETAITATMARLGIPGLSVAIVSQGALRFANGYGLADVENDVPAKAATVYRLASVSKPITAVAVLQLAEKGALDLDVPIQRYVPTFPEKPWPVTARQLLGHLGGVRHYRDDEPANTRPYGGVLDGLAFFKDDPLAAEPGTRFVYSTYGYNLLGAAVEGASGQPFFTYLHDHVLGPAGMTSTRPDEVGPIIMNRAPGYRRAASGELRNSALADVSYKVPGGGLCATAPDVARFGLALESGVLLAKETLDRMLTSQRTRSGRVTGYGLGVDISSPGKRREAWHSGGQEQVSTALFLLPEAGVSVAVLSNLEGVGGELVALSRRIADVVAAEPVAAKRDRR
jgi:CubicO group peptidase (beta-lactamase class C family)